MTDKLKPADMMPGSFGLPFIGHTIEVLIKLELFYWQQYQKYGNIVRKPFSMQKKLTATFRSLDSKHT
jgi:hypothetical protein